MKDQIRRDSKHRVLHVGESQRTGDGKYLFKYTVNGKPHFLTSWRLTPTDKQPQGTKPMLSLRELEQQLGKDMDSQLNPTQRNMTVKECVERYLQTKTGVKPNTMMNYNFVKNLMEKEDFYGRRIKSIKVSDAKLFLIKKQNDGKHFSTVKTVRGVLRPAFQMAVDDEIIAKNPFEFELAGVVVNDECTREAITRDQMRRFLKFILDDNVYCKYYEAVFILFNTGMRIFEFCGLTVKDLDMEKHIINIDHQLQRVNMKLHIETTKTNAGTRKIPMTDEVYQMFQAILEDREAPPNEQMVDGYFGFLYLDENGLPEVAMHWENRFNRMVKRYNDIYKVQMPNITPHVCRHTYCSNMARSGMNPKTLQYLMSHSDIGVTMNVYTHLGLDDAEAEMIRLQEVEDAKKEVERETGQKAEKAGFKLYKNDENRRSQWRGYTFHWLFCVISAGFMIGWKQIFF